MDRKAAYTPTRICHRPGRIVEKYKVFACSSACESPSSVAHHRPEWKKGLESCIGGSLHLIQDYCLVLNDLVTYNTESFGCLATLILEVEDNLSILHLVLKYHLLLGSGPSAKSTVTDHIVFLCCQKLEAEAHCYLLGQYVHT